MFETEDDIIQLDRETREELATKEWHKILDYFQDLERKRIEELKKQGIIKGGLDDGNQYMTDIRKERDRRPTDF